MPMSAVPQEVVSAQATKNEANATRVEYHDGTGALKIEIKEPGYNVQAEEYMAADVSCMLLKRERGLVHSCTEIDAAAIEAFQRDGVVQVSILHHELVQGFGC